MPPKSTPKGTGGSAKTKKVLYYDYSPRSLFVFVAAGDPNMPAGRHFVRMLLVASPGSRLEIVVDLNMLESYRNLPL